MVVTFDTTDAQIVRPYISLLVPSFPTQGYTSRFDTTDTLPPDTHRPITSCPICPDFAIDVLPIWLSQ